jgi:hypothetical protein
MLEYLAAKKMKDLYDINTFSLCRPCNLDQTRLLEFLVDYTALVLLNSLII